MLAAMGAAVVIAMPASAQDTDRPAPAEIPRFVDATAVAGLAHVYGDEDPSFVVGGGAAAFDCDGDGRLDLALAGGTGPVTLWRNASEPGGPISLAPVEDASAALDLTAEEMTRVTGVWALHADADTAPDLFLARFGRNKLLRGLGDCRFEDATEALGVPDRADWTAAFAADWLPGDDAPTFAIGNYVDRDRPLDKRGNCQPSYLAGPGRAGETPLFPVSCPLSMLFVDWSGTGRRDLRIATDRQYADPGVGEQLFRLEAGGAARALGPEDGWDGPVIWGMGLAAGDLDGDARPEIVATNMAENRLDGLAPAAFEAATDAPRPAFENRAFALGAMSQRPYVGPDPRPSTSWHTAFEDFNNDGLLDLWIVKGNVAEMPEFANFDPDSLLLGRPGGGFAEVGFEAGVALPIRGRGGVSADLNADGLLDLVVVAKGEPARLLQAVPTGAAQNWLAISLAQDGANPGAVGATLVVETATGLQRRAAFVGGGHGGGVLGPLHVGLGDATDARLRVAWPDGTLSPWRSVAANRRVEIRRGAE